MTTTTTTDLWYTDRSRYKLGTSRCARARYLAYHFGPTGYGITAKRESLPLATGISVHQGLQAFTSHLASFDALPVRVDVRAVIHDVCQAYVDRVEARGYRGILGGPDTEETITEQALLISGLLWALYLKFLPWLHRNYQVLSVESERLHPLDADKALMLRTDLLAKRHGGSSLAYFECKTTGWESDAWAEQWETDPQLALGTLDCQELYGGEVSELFVVGLNKGRRMKERDDPEGRKKQLSPLCYGYRRPANPPLGHDDWLPAYEWVNSDGELKRASRAHRRTGIWELEHSDWPTWRAYQGANPGLGASEFWMEMLPASVVDRICFILGPMNRQDVQLQSLLRNIEGEEDRWQRRLWALYESQQHFPWSSPQFQAELDRLIPCSWACRPFGREHQCEFVPICHRYQGWDDPLQNGYQPRLPHHDPELQQAITRGLLPENAEALEDDE